MDISTEIYRIRKLSNQDLHEELIAALTRQENALRDGSLLYSEKRNRMVKGTWLMDDAPRADAA